MPLCGDLAKKGKSVRNWLFGLPMIAVVAIIGISPVSALVVSTGSQVFAVDWSKTLDKQPFGVVWAKMDDSGHAITGLAAFGDFDFEGIGLALETPVDICAYSGNCAGGSDDGLHPDGDHHTGSGLLNVGGTPALPKSDAFSSLSEFPTGTPNFDFGTDTDNVGSQNQPSGNFVNFGTDTESGNGHNRPCSSSCGGDPTVPVSEPASLAIVGGALFLFGWLRRHPLFGGLSSRLISHPVLRCVGR
jgi:hypothetical protein